MENYKGFILDEIIVLETYSYVRVIDPNTNKTLYSQSIQEAKDTIDKWFTESGKLLAEKTIEAFEKKREANKKLIEQYEEDIAILTQKIENAKNETKELADRLPPKFW